MSLLWVTKYKDTICHSWSIEGAIPLTGDENEKSRLYLRTSVLFLHSFSEHSLLGIVTLTATDTDLNLIYNKPPILFCLSWKGFKGRKISAEIAACISSCVKEEVILQSCSPLLECIGLVHCFLRQMLQKTLLHANMLHDFLSSLLAAIKYVKMIPKKITSTRSQCPEGPGLG